MHRTTLAAPAAILATLAVAAPAMATNTPPSASTTISTPYQKDGRCLVDVQFTADHQPTYFGRAARWGDQVNVDGRFVVEHIAQANSSGGDRWGATVDVGATNSGIHDVSSYLLGVEAHRVADCGTPTPPEPKVVYIDRTVEKQVFVPVPVPTPERCVVTKTVVAYVAGRHGHHGPTFTRLTFKRTDGGGVVGRTNVAHRETKRVRVTAPCGTRLRIDASIATRGGHRLVRRTVRLADDGFSTVGVSFGRYGA